MKICLSLLILMLMPLFSAVAQDADSCYPDDVGYQSPFDWDDDGWCDNAEACDNDLGTDLCPVDYDANNTDMDSDGFGDVCDNCPLVTDADLSDKDVDGVGDVCDSDRDGDLILNDRDNCPGVQNSDQANMDSDEKGDACDDDLDGDGVDNAADACPFDPAVQLDDGSLDLDDAGCTGDSDGDDVNDFGIVDGVTVALDNCRFDPNPPQRDVDGDGKGDICDPDADGDEIPDTQDNCNYRSLISRANAYNATDAVDSDLDPIDLLEWTDEMWLANLVNPEQIDGDKDRMGDVCDIDFSQPTADGGFEPENCYVVLGDVNNCLDVDADSLEVYTPAVIAAYTSHDPQRLRLFANREQTRMRYRWQLVSGNRDGITLENVTGIVDCSTSYEYHYPVEWEVPRNGDTDAAELVDYSPTFVVNLAGRYIVRLTGTLVDESNEPLSGPGTTAEAEVVINATGVDEYIDEGCSCSVPGAQSGGLPVSIWTLTALLFAAFLFRRSHSRR